MALSPHQTGRAHHRREAWHRRIARRTVPQRIIVQTDLSRPLGDKTRNVTGAKRREENAQRSTSNTQIRTSSVRSFANHGLLVENVETAIAAFHVKRADPTWRRHPITAHSVLFFPIGE